MENYQIEPVRGKDRVSYHCSQCGQCCRHIKNSIMLESLDAYRLAAYLLKQGAAIEGIEDVYHQYGMPAPLTEAGYPIFLMQTKGTDNSCIFLKDGSCSIYPVRPRTCRIYPFTVGPGQRGKNFEYYLCTDKPHHLSGGMVSVKDWFYTNLRQEDKEFVLQEFQYTAQIGTLMKRIVSSKYEHALFLLLYYCYYNYDLQAPFMPQYTSNHDQLLEELQRLL